MVDVIVIDDSDEEQTTALGGVRFAPVNAAAIQTSSTAANGISNTTRNPVPSVKPTNNNTATVMNTTPKSNKNSSSDRCMNPNSKEEINKKNTSSSVVASKVTPSPLPSVVKKVKLNENITSTPFYPPPARVSSASVLYPSYYSDPRKALLELLERYAPSRFEDFYHPIQFANWCTVGNGSNINAFPGILIGLFPVILPITSHLPMYLQAPFMLSHATRNTAAQATETIATASHSNSSRMTTTTSTTTGKRTLDDFLHETAKGTETAKSTINNEIHSPEVHATMGSNMSLVHFLASLQIFTLNIVQHPSFQLSSNPEGLWECPPHCISFQNPNWHSQLESTLGTDALASLLGVRPADFKSSDTAVQIAPHMELTKVLFQYSSVTDDIRKSHSSEGPSSLNGDPQHFFAEQMSKLSCISAMLSSSSVKPGIVPVGFLLLFLPSEYTGGDVHLFHNVKSTDKTDKKEAVDMDIHETNTYSYQYVAWFDDHLDGRGTEIQFDRLLSGCRMFFLYSLGVRVRTDSTKPMNTTNLPTFLKNRVEQGDVDNIVKSIAYEWNESVSLKHKRPTDTNLQSIIYCLPMMMNYTKVNSSEKKYALIQTLDGAIEAGADLDYCLVNMSFVERGTISRPSTSSSESVWQRTTETTLTVDANLGDGFALKRTLRDSEIDAKIKSFFMDLSPVLVEDPSPAYSCYDSSSKSGKQMRPVVKGVLIWPRCRSWTVLNQEWNRHNTDLKLLSSSSVPKFMTYLLKGNHSSLPSQKSRNLELFTQLIEWWTSKSNVDTSVISNLLCNVVTMSNEDTAQAYVKVLISETSSQRSNGEKYYSVEAIMVVLLDDAFLRKYGMHFTAEIKSFSKYLENVSLVKRINFAGQLHRLICRKMPDHPVGVKFCSDVMLGVINSIINKDHPNRLRWYGELQNLLSGCSDLSFLLEYICKSAQKMNGGATSIDYDKLATEFMTTLCKTIGRNRNAYSYSYLSVENTSKILKESKVKNIVQLCIGTLLQEVDEITSVILLFYLTDSSRRNYQRHIESPGGSFARQLIDKLLKENPSNLTDSMDIWDITVQILSRFATINKNAIILNKNQTFSSSDLSSYKFIDYVIVESEKNGRIASYTMKKGLISLFQVLTSVPKLSDSSSNVFVRLFNTLEAFQKFSNFCGVQETAAYLLSTVQLSLTTGAMFMIDLLSCIQVSPTPVNSVTHVCQLMLASFLEQFSGDLTSNHIIKIYNILKDSSTSHTSIHKNLISSVFQFVSKVVCENTVGTTNITNTLLERFLLTFLLAVSHDTPTMVKVEGVTERCLCQRILSKSDLVAAFTKIGEKRLPSFLQMFLDNLQLIPAIDFVATFIHMLNMKDSPSDEKRLKTSITWLAFYCADACATIMTQPLLLNELKILLVLNIMNRTISDKAKVNSDVLMNASGDSIRGSLKNVPYMSPSLLISGLCTAESELNKQGTTQNSYTTSILAIIPSFISIICEASLFNSGNKNESQSIDKLFSKESFDIAIQRCGYENVSGALLPMITSYLEKGLLSAQLCYYLRSSGHENTMLPLVVNILLFGLNFSTFTPEALTLIVILVANCEEANSLEFNRLWNDAVIPLWLKAMPDWKRHALGLSEPIIEAREVKSSVGDLATNAETQMTLHKVEIPQGTLPGEKFNTVVNCTRFSVTCPLAYKPGMLVVIKAPKKPDPTENVTSSPREYELTVPLGIVSEQEVKVKWSGGTPVTVKCPKDVKPGDTLRFPTPVDPQVVIHPTIASPPGITSSDANSVITPNKVVEPSEFVKRFFRKSSSDHVNKMLNYAETFLCNNSTKSQRAASLFADITRQLINQARSGEIVKVPEVPASTVVMRTYQLQKEPLKTSQNNFPIAVHNFLASPCLNTYFGKFAMSYHRMLDRYITVNSLPVRASYSKVGSSWHVELTKTLSYEVKNDDKSPLCTCGGRNSLCQAIILNPTMPDPKKAGMNSENRKKEKKIDFEQLDDLLIRFESVSKGMDLEPEVEIVAAPERILDVVDLIE